MKNGLSFQEFLDKEDLIIKNPEAEDYADILGIRLISKNNTQILSFLHVIGNKKKHILLVLDHLLNKIIKAAQIFLSPKTLCR